MTDLVDTIVNSFLNSTIDGMVSHNTDNNSMIFFTFSSNGEYGVIIPAESNADIIDEMFSEIRFYSHSIKLPNGPVNSLVLSCSNMQYARKFATICSDFVNPDDPKQRQIIITDPLSWWIEWTKLIGNRLWLQEPYSIIGEMTVVDYLHRSGYHPKWEGLSGSVRDIVCDGRSIEVKSTISRYSYNIEASGEFQLEPSEDMSLYFCRFEKSESGNSIDDMVDKLVSIEYGSREEIEKQLASAGIPRGRSIRKTKYRLIQMMEYPVDDNFPCITSKSFLNGTIPQGISHIRYTIDLETILKPIVIDYQDHRAL